MKNGGYRFAFSQIGIRLLGEWASPPWYHKDKFVYFKEKEIRDITINNYVSYFFNTAYVLPKKRSLALLDTSPLYALIF